mgnify:FL=1
MVSMAHYHLTISDIMGLSSLTNGYLEQPGIIQSQIKNTDLKWETNLQP